VVVIVKSSYIEKKMGDEVFILTSTAWSESSE
jgi:hypothetical protein